MRKSLLVISGEGKVKLFTPQEICTSHSSYDKYLKLVFAFAFKRFFENWNHILILFYILCGTI